MLIQWNIRAGNIAEPMREKYNHDRFAEIYNIKSPKFQKILETQMRKKMKYTTVREVRNMIRVAKTKLTRTTVRARYVSIVGMI